MPPHPNKRFRLLLVLSWDRVVTAGQLAVKPKNTSHHSVPCLTLLLLWVVLNASISWSYLASKWSKLCCVQTLTTAIHGVVESGCGWSHALKKPTFKFSKWILPPTPHKSTSTSRLLTWWMLPGLPCFSLVFHSCGLLWTQMKVEMGEAWERGSCQHTVR